MTSRHLRKALSAALLGGVALLGACANSDTVHCKVGADCASGVCNADGTCEPVGDTSSGGGGSGAGGSTGGSSEGGSGTGGSSVGGSGTGGSGTGGSGVCSPNDDGTITAAEMPFAAGLSAKYKVAVDADFDTAGEMVGGEQVWDFTGALSGDHAVIVETVSVDGTWYGADFPGASYATRLSDSADLLGVFEVKEDGLFLMGVVSPTDGITATKLTYDPAVKVFAFPMKKGDTWETTSTVTGTASGVFSVYTETYSSQVDAVGMAKTPYADFQVLRVGTDLTRVVGALVTTSRTFAFAAECFGPVATVVSQTNELDNEFTTASELRRLSP